VTIDADLRYSAQVPPPTGWAPPPSGTRTDVVFLDAFLATEETGALMENPDDVGVQTSVRLKPAWRVRVAVGEPVPPADRGHGHLPLAQIARRAGQAKIMTDAITDLRTHCFAHPGVQRLLMEPTVLTVSPNPQPTKDMTVIGRNFQFFRDEPVKVSFDGEDLAPGVSIAVTSTSLTFKVPTFTGLPANKTLAVRTPYGSAQATVRIFPL
jgi:hypothetical protein